MSCGEASLLRNSYSSLFPDDIPNRNVLLSIPCIFPIVVRASFWFNKIICVDYQGYSVKWYRLQQWHTHTHTNTLIKRTVDEDGCVRKMHQSESNSLIKRIDYNFFLVVVSRLSKWHCWYKIIVERGKKSSDWSKKQKERQGADYNNRSISNKKAHDKMEPIQCNGSLSATAKSSVQWLNFVFIHSPPKSIHLHSNLWNLRKIENFTLPLPSFSIRFILQMTIILIFILCRFFFSSFFGVCFVLICSLNLVGRVYSLRLVCLCVCCEGSESKHTRAESKMPLQKFQTAHPVNDDDEDTNECDVNKLKISAV